MSKRFVLWEVLEAQNRSIASLARDAGFSPNLAYRIRMGNRRASPAFRKACARVLQLPESVLFRPEQAA